MEIVSPARSSMLSRFRPLPVVRSPLMQGRPPAPMPYRGRSLGQPRTNILDTRFISFAANTAATVVAFVGAQRFNPGFWKTSFYVVGFVTGIRSLNDMFNLYEAAKPPAQ